MLPTDSPSELMHNVPQRLAQQCFAAGFGCLHPNVHQTFFAIKRGMRRNNEAIMTRILRIAPRGDERMVRRGRFCG